LRGDFDNVLKQPKRFGWSASARKCMNKQQIFELIKNNVLEVLPDIDPARIVPSASLRELGANSIDRDDILIQSQEMLKLKFPLHEMGAARNIQGLVDLFDAKISASLS
jgi:polyketide biosynthesis acyl carrier protein